MYDWTDTRQLAIDTFKNNSKFLMRASIIAVANVLHLNLTQIN